MAPKRRGRQLGIAAGPQDRIVQSLGGLIFMDFAAAVARGEAQALRRAVDESFDARARMLELDPRHVELIERARSAGAAANFTGSGRAVECVCADGEQRLAVDRTLRQAGARTLAL